MSHTWNGYSSSKINVCLFKLCSKVLWLKKILTAKTRVCYLESSMKLKAKIYTGWNLCDKICLSLWLEYSTYQPNMITSRRCLILCNVNQSYPKTSLINFIQLKHQILSASKLLPMSGVWLEIKAHINQTCGHII